MIEMVFTHIFLHYKDVYVSQGDTLEEALANIKESLDLYLEDMDIEEKEKLSESSYIIAPTIGDIPRFQMSDR